MSALATLKELLSTKILAKFTDGNDDACKIFCNHKEITLEFSSNLLLHICEILKTDKQLDFAMLLDVCGVDYLHYGKSEWQTNSATTEGFSRAVVDTAMDVPHISKPQQRFAVVYHLLSLNKNHRIRLRTYALGEPPTVDSVVAIWPGANWFEREAFDLFGIEFNNHPDLRRILTDYDFDGHPLRKDFPLEGRVERKYDAEKSEVVYQPVSIEPRVLVPKVIRDDSRYNE
ncbi:MAG: NADH-quinone oxidoreductase subunit C [Legionellales bacterium]|nr:MAG: NADH-quinone oxidoreductase subunit C [Legionellales bacterium]